MPRKPPRDHQPASAPEPDPAPEIATDSPAAADLAAAPEPVAESDDTLAADRDAANESEASEPADAPPDPMVSDELVGDRPGPARAAPRSVSELHLRGILESLVFVSDKPLTVSELAKVARADAKDVRRLLSELREEYRTRGIHLDEIAGGWQFRSSTANAPFVRELLQARPVRLTRAQVETLAIIAYRQPITRPEVDEIRGVDSGSAIKVLLERELIRMLGRKEDVGRPVLYGTTNAFLEFFGLKSLRDLPTLREFTELTPESEATLVRELGDVEETSPDAAATSSPSESDVATEPAPVVETATDAEPAPVVDAAIAPENEGATDAPTESAPDSPSTTET